MLLLLQALPSMQIRLATSLDRCRTRPYQVLGYHLVWICRAMQEITSAPTWASLTSIAAHRTMNMMEYMECRVSLFCKIGRNCLKQIFNHIFRYIKATSSLDVQEQIQPITKACFCLITRSPAWTIESYRHCSYSINNCFCSSSNRSWPLDNNSYYSNICERLIHQDWIYCGEHHCLILIFVPRNLRKSWRSACRVVS